MKYDYSKPVVQCCMSEVMCHPMSQSDKHPNNFSTEDCKRNKNKQNSRSWKLLVIDTNCRDNTENNGAC